MNHLTLKQAANLIVRFFGFYLLFFLPFNLTEFPGYWLRSSFSHLHSSTRISFETSYDVSLLMFCVRQVSQLILGIFFFRKPNALASLLLEYFDVQQPPPLE